MRSLVIIIFLYGCAPVAIIGEQENPIIERPTLQLLVDLPAPERKAVVSVYDFPDLTGQRKSSDNMALFSSAVTQGADLYLIEALMQAGGGTWFTVIERSGLANLTRERQLIVKAVINCNHYCTQDCCFLVQLLLSIQIMRRAELAQECSVLA